MVNERPNIVQSMLEAFARCHPLPELKPELLTFLAKTHNAWMHAIAPLETRITVECAVFSVHVAIRLLNSICHQPQLGLVPCPRHSYRSPTSRSPRSTRR